MTKDDAETNQGEGLRNLIVRLKPDEHRRLKVHAAKAGETIATVVRTRLADIIGVGAGVPAEGRAP